MHNSTNTTHKMHMRCTQKVYFLPSIYIKHTPWIPSSWPLRFVATTIVNAVPDLLDTNTFLHCFKKRLVQTSWTPNCNSGSHTLANYHYKRFCGQMYLYSIINNERTGKPPRADRSSNQSDRLLFHFITEPSVKDISTHFP